MSQDCLKEHHQVNGKGRRTHQCAMQVILHWLGPKRAGTGKGKQNTEDVEAGDVPQPKECLPRNKRSVGVGVT